MAQEYTELMAARGVVGHYYQVDFHPRNPFSLAYVSRAPTAETLMKANDAFNAAAGQADSAEANLIMRIQNCITTDAHYLDHVVGPAITTKPGYYQVWVIEPQCSVPSLLGINQRFEKLFGVDMELHLPMEGSPSFTTVAIVVQWKDGAAHGRGWDQWNAGEGKALQELKAEFDSCWTTVDGVTLRTLF